MKNKFNVELFTKAVTDKMYEMMRTNKTRIGVVEFGKQIGCSAATFSRISRGKPTEIETFFRVCIWLDKSADEFCDKEVEE